MATVVSPYTVFTVDVLGVLAGGAFLLVLLRTLPRAAAVPIAVTAVLAVTLLPQLWNMAGASDGVRPSLEPTHGFSPAEQCLVQRGAFNVVTITRWLAKRVPQSATFSWVGVGRGFDLPCVQLALLPRRMVSPSEHPQFTVHTGEDAATRALVRADRRLPPDQRKIDVYAPGLILERHT